MPQLGRHFLRNTSKPVEWISMNCGSDDRVAHRMKWNNFGHLAQSCCVKVQSHRAASFIIHIMVNRIPEMPLQRRLLLIPLRFIWPWPWVRTYHEPDGSLLVYVDGDVSALDPGVGAQMSQSYVRVSGRQPAQFLFERSVKSDTV